MSNLEEEAYGDDSGEDFLELEATSSSSNLIGISYLILLLIIILWLDYYKFINSFFNSPVMPNIED